MSVPRVLANVFCASTTLSRSSLPVKFMSTSDLLHDPDGAAVGTSSFCSQFGQSNPLATKGSRHWVALPLSYLHAGSSPGAPIPLPHN